MIRLDIKSYRSVRIKEVYYNSCSQSPIYGGNMNYLTSAEQAKEWNVSQRWVAILCKDGRIEGAVLKGHTWLM